MEARTISYGDIGWAINHVRHGHKMRRAAWPQGVYVALDSKGGQPGVIRLFGPQSAAEAADHPLPRGTLYESATADLLNTDWALLDPVKPGEYHA